jgi:hypothetical protein
MPTRIRYFNTNEPTIIQSVKTYQHPNNGARYKVKIDKEKLQYFVVEDMSETIVATGRAVNLHQVKIKAKKMLVELGISFEYEARLKTA